MVDFERLDKETNIRMDYGIWNPKKPSKIEVAIHLIYVILVVSVFVLFRSLYSDKQMDIMYWPLIITGIILFFVFVSILYLIDKFYRQRDIKRVKFYCVFGILVGLIIFILGWFIFVYDLYGSSQYAFIPYLIPMVFIIRIIFEWRNNFLI